MPEPLQAPKWRTRCGEGSGVSEFAVHSFPTPARPHRPSHPPGPILAVSSASRFSPPRHVDPQTCGGPGWGEGTSAAERSAHHPPRPRTDHYFRHQEGRGGGPRSRCFRRVVALGRLAPVPATPGERPTIFCGPTRGCGRAWRLRSPRCFAPGQPDTPAPRAPRAGSSDPGERLGVLYLLRLRLSGPPLALTPSGTPQAGTEKAASDDRV